MIRCSSEWNCTLVFSETAGTAVPQGDEVQPRVPAGWGTRGTTQPGSGAPGPEGEDGDSGEPMPRAFLPRARREPCCLPTEFVGFALWFKGSWKTSKFYIFRPSANSWKRRVGFLGFSGEAGDINVCNVRFAWEFFQNTFSRVSYWTPLPSFWFQPSWKQFLESVTVFWL